MGHKDWRARVVRFAERATNGELVVLKKPHHRKKKEEGRWRIQAVGRISGDYDYLEQFEDVEGWGLQHCRKVEWVCPQQETLTNGLSMGTFRRVLNSGVIEKAKQVWKEERKQESRYIPPPARKLSDEDLVEGLIENGLRPANAETVIQTIWQVRRLARWYERYGRDLGEHEVRTFLIVPILLALGWSEQRIKIEWKRTDMSFFHKPYSRGQQPQMILESKRMREGLGYAERQAVRYAKQFPGCHRLVASDGIRYQLYVRRDSDWNVKGDFKAYMNLTNLKNRHPYLEEVGGAPDLFISLMPN